jgi:hypothetical protein
MPGPADFTKFVPGFDFLQGLVKTAGQTLPGMGQWIAPSLDPKELEKRIEQLRTVQFWLEQNARLLGATIQALEVQRMTLSTLQSMNVPMDGLREAFTLRPGAGAPSAPTPAASAAQVREQAPQETSEQAPEEMPEEDATEAPAPTAAAAAGVDPMQWWGALTQQFTHLAAQALKDNAPEMARPLTDRMAEGMERAGAAVAGAPAPARAAAAKKAAKKAAKSATTKTAKAAPKKPARAPAPTGSGSRAATPASPRRARR